MQISDSHIGFGKDPCKKLKRDRYFSGGRGRDQPAAAAADFLIHTGDLTHLATPREFDTVSEVLKGAKVGKVFCVPGEHDVIGDGSEYLKRFGQGTEGEGWSASTTAGCTSFGLVNVASQGTDEGLGILGDEQLDWLKADVAKLADSTPVVVSATSRSGRSSRNGAGARRIGAQALGYLKRFGSVTVLTATSTNRREGRRNMTFHTARSPASPSRAPASALGEQSETERVTTINMANLVWVGGPIGCRLQQMWEELQAKMQSVFSIHRLCLELQRNRQKSSAKRPGRNDRHRVMRLSDPMDFFPFVFLIESHNSEDGRRDHARAMDPSHYLVKTDRTASFGSSTWVLGSHNKR